MAQVLAVLLLLILTLGGPSNSGVEPLSSITIISGPRPTNVPLVCSAHAHEVGNSLSLSRPNSTCLEQTPSVSMVSVGSATFPNVTASGPTSTSTSTSPSVVGSLSSLSLNPFLE